MLLAFMGLPEFCFFAFVWFLSIIYAQAANSSLAPTHV